MLTAAAIVPIPPLLVPEVAGGAADRDADLREACLSAVAALAGSGASRVVVVGSSPATQRYEGSWDFRPWGVAHPASPVAVRLPLSLAIGTWLLDTAGVTLPRVLQGVGPRVPRPRAAELGAAHVAEVPTALLVCGDGTPSRDEKAPGHFDPRSEAFDASVEAAVRGGDPQALLGLDPMLAEQLRVDGLVAWQVLGGAAAGRAWSSRVGYCAAPYGVGYLAALWTPAGDLGSRS